MDKISIIDLKIPAKHGVYEFEKDNKAKFYWYDDFITEYKIRNFNFKIPNVEQYSWKYIFEDIQFKQFIDNVLSK